MKKIIKITESDLKKIVLRVIYENEEEWIDNSSDMEDLDFSKIKIEKRIFNNAKNAVEELDEKDKEILKSFIKSNGSKKLVSMVKSEISDKKTPIDESDSGLNKVRKILSKLILSMGVVTGVSAAVAPYLISSGISSALTLTTISLGLLAHIIKPKK